MLTVATAAIHFSRAVADPQIRVLFALNGAGYLALAALLYVPLPQLGPYRHWVRWTPMDYAAVTIVLYGARGAMSGEWTVPWGRWTNWSK